MKKLFQNIKIYTTKHLFLFGFFAGILFVFVAFCFVGYFFFNGPKENKVTNTPIPSIEPSSTPLPVVLKASEIKWLDTPQRITKLNVFKAQEEIDALLSDSYGGSPNISSFYFVKVADLNDNSILVNAYIPQQYYFGVNYIRFVIKGKEIKALVDEIGYYNEDAIKIINQNIPVEYGLVEGLDIPKQISLGSMEVYNDYPTFEEFNTLKLPQKISESQYGSLYVVYTQHVAPDPLFDRIIYLKLKDGTAVRYSLKADDSRYDNNVQKIAWVDGSPNETSFNNSPFWGGCSGVSTASVQVVKSLDIDLIQKEEVGKDVNGSIVYKLTNSSIEALKLAYKQYKDTHTGNGDETVVSYSEFLSDMNNILMKDNFGDWVFYLNPKYAQLAECGKPVIYLYPKDEQQVNVQIGAKITESDPIYPTGGWDVFAKPNGELIYQGKNYPYLFWEGLGNGIYPEVKNRGFVVAKDEIEKTLKEHLFKLGLNEKESKDFLEFWLPKMPKTPFARLTWLMTNDMDKLAPLTVSPKPNTQIRIFLDFEGLSQKISLTPQKLFAPKRSGFTLVEWGGLLIK